MLFIGSLFALVLLIILGVLVFLYLSSREDQMLSGTSLAIRANRPSNPTSSRSRSVPPKMPSSGSYTRPKWQYKPKTVTRFNPQSRRYEQVEVLALVYE